MKWCWIGLHRWSVSADGLFRRCARCHAGEQFNDAGRWERI